VIERYTLPAMGNLWTDRYKYQTWLEVEIAVCEAQAELGYIPGDAVEEIKAKANFDPDRILEISRPRTPLYSHGGTFPRHSRRTDHLWL